MILYTNPYGDYSIHSLEGLFGETSYIVCRFTNDSFSGTFSHWVIVYYMSKLELCFEWLYQHNHISKDEYTSEILKLKVK